MKVLLLAALMCVVACQANPIHIELVESKASLSSVTFRIFLDASVSDELEFFQSYSPLEGLRSDMFEITNEEGVPVPYNGKLERRLPIQESEYLQLAAGETLDVTIELYPTYMFPGAGEYNVKLRRNTWFLKQFASYEVTIRDEKIYIRTENASPQNYWVQSDSTLAWTNCNSQEQSQTKTAIGTSLGDVGRAETYMNNNPSGGSATTKWFGTYSSKNFNYDHSCYSTIRDVLNPNTFNAYCRPAGCGDFTYGYVYPFDSSKKVYLCNLFFRTTNQERVFTITHEYSHFNAVCGTNDYAYGKSPCLSLAESNPTEASHNADNVAYFSEDAN